MGTLAANECPETIAIEVEADLRTTAHALRAALRTPVPRQARNCPSPPPECAPRGLFLAERYGRVTANG